VNREGAASEEEYVGEVCCGLPAPAFCCFGDMGEVGISRSSTILSSSSVSSRKCSSVLRRGEGSEWREGSIIGLQLKLADGVRPVGVLQG